MTVTATVLYPAESDATFDMNYYLATHMPLVEKNWAQYGMTDWKIVQLGKSPDGSQQFSVQAILTWKDEESLQKALGSGEAKNVFGDVPNFSNKSPLFLKGDVVGAS